MAIDNWDEFRTVFEVAEAGTVAGAAARLGVSPAVVVRHIDAIEECLGVKVFHRNRQQYAPTAIGTELIDAGSRANRVISDFVRAHRRSNAGEGLIVSAPPGLSPFLLLTSKVFRAEHPTTCVQVIAAEEQPRLERGEAHVFFQVGEEPEVTNAVVHPLPGVEGGVYVHREYIEMHGRPSGVDDFDGHHFVLMAESFKSPPSDWLRQRVHPRDVIMVAGNPCTAFQAVLDGIGIGLLPTLLAEGNPNMEEILAPVAEFQRPVWAVTSTEACEQPKLKAFIRCLHDLNVRSSQVGA